MAIAVMNTEYVPAKIVIGAYEFLSEEYNIDSISITTGSYDGNVVGIGSAYSPSCRVTMDNVDAIDVGVVFSVYFQKNGAWENYGKFVITEEPDVYNREKMSFVGEGYIYSIMSKQYKGVPGIGYNIELGTEIQYELFIKNFQSEFGFELIFSDSIKNELCTRHPINILLPQEKTDTTLYAWEFIKISWREWLQGIAILFGANVIEKNGKIYITELENSFSETETIQISSSDCAELKLSRKDYTINGTKIKYQKTNDLDKPWDAEETYNWDINGPNVGISGTGEASIKYNLTFVENAIAYQYEIFCSWLRGTILYFNAKRIIEQDIYDEGSELNPQYIAYFPEEAYLPNELIKANNVVYRPGVIEYSGIVDEIEAGKVISIKNEDGTSYKFYVGEMTLEWDGGFKTILSCNSPANNSSSSASSSISGGINVQTPASSSYASLVQGLLGHVSLNFADITFSNIKDSTISGSKFIDGSITGSKIADSSIDGSKINFSTFENGVISGTAIDTSTFKDGSISGSSFVDGTIENSKIKDSTLTGAKIADATIGFEKVDTSFIKKLTADKAYIDSLSANVASISTLKATDAIIKNIFSQEIVGDKAILDVLQANIINAEYIKSAVADVGYITADEAAISYADITLGNIDTANIDVAKIGLLFTQVGLIDRATIVDGHVTGYLDSVDVNANKITSGTLSTDRLIIRDPKDPTKSIIYEINNITGAMQAVQGDTLNGEVLTDRSVNVDKIVAGSITANELDVTNIFGDSAVINEIFAQDITATGTITGAKLYGTYAEINSGKLGGLSVSSENGLTFSFGNTKCRIGQQSHGDGIIIFKNSSTDYTQAIYSTEGMYLRDSDDGGWDVIINTTNASLPGASLTELMADFGESIKIGNKIVGGKWCYNDTTSYGLYWSSASVLRPISSSYKVSLGSSSYPMSSIYATTLYEGGKLLKNKYAVVKTNTGSKKGTGGWTSITINFGVTFTTIPMFNVMFTNGFTTENISVTDISTTSATIWICALDKSFTYQYRWFAVGNIA